MSAGDRDTLAAELGKHRDLAEDTLQTCVCACGARICPEDGGMSHDWHFRAHVADVIASSDWLREQRAEAWEEGRDHGRDNSRDGFCLCTDDGWARSDECLNPYRRLTENPDAD